MSESMIELVARAIMVEENPDAADQYTAMARAAIEAMREPTKAMLEAEVVSRAENRLDEGNVLVNYIVPILDIWPQMIDAALSEKP